MAKSPSIPEAVEMDAVERIRHALRKCGRTDLAASLIIEGLLEYAPDFPGNAADNALEKWRGGTDRKQRGHGRRRRNRPLFPQEFIGEYVPEWRDMLSRILSRKEK